MMIPTLTLGEVALRLQLQDEGLARLIQKEYDGFLSTRETPYQLRLNYTSRLHPDEEQFNLTAGFNNDYFYLRSTALICFYRLATGRGVLHVAPSDYGTEAVLQNGFRYLCQLLALQQHSIFFHAAGIYHWGLQKAFLFMGASGSGKTTICRLSSTSEYQIISDDLVLVGITPGGIKLYPSPFFGELKGESSHCQAFPVAGIFLIRKGKDNQITTPLSTSEQVATLAANLPYVESYDRLRQQQILSLLAQLAYQQPLSQLTFTKQPSFWEEITFFFNNHRGVKNVSSY